MESHKIHAPNPQPPTAIEIYLGIWKYIDLTWLMLHFHESNKGGSRIITRDLRGIQNHYPWLTLDGWKWMEMVFFDGYPLLIKHGNGWCLLFFFQWKFQIKPGISQLAMEIITTVKAATAQVQPSGLMWKKLGSSTKIWCEVWIGTDDIWLDINYSIL